MTQAPAGPHSVSGPPADPGDDLALLAKARKVLDHSEPDEGDVKGRQKFFETALEHQADFYNHDRDEESFEP